MFFCAGCEKENNDFLYSIENPGIITLEPGKFRDEKLLIRGLSAEDQKVHLVINGLPAGLAASIDTPRGTPGFIATVRYSADEKMAVGFYAFEMVGRSENGTVVAYKSGIQVIAYGSCIERLAGTMNVAQEKDTTGTIYKYKANILCKASDSGLFYIENFGNRGFKVKGNFDCTSQDIIIPDQWLGATKISGSGRILADSFAILATIQDLSLIHI